MPKGIAPKLHDIAGLLQQLRVMAFCNGGSQKCTLDISAIVAQMTCSEAEA